MVGPAKQKNAKGKPDPAPPQRENRPGRPQGIFKSSNESPLMLPDMDEDLESLTRNQLIEEIKKLRAGIREHRDSTMHELCWHHPQLWNLLPEKVEPDVAVPAWPQFLRGCVRYRESLDRQLPDAPRLADEHKGDA
jgi:hypothetical protein